MTDFRFFDEAAPVPFCVSCKQIIMPEKRVDLEEYKDLCHDCYKQQPKHICVDFDGVLAHYDGWKGSHVLGDPRQGIEEFLAGLNEIGFRVVIFTTRNSAVVGAWLTHFGLQKYVHEITSTKKPAVAYIDDRAIPFEGDFGDCLEAVKGFVPYWKRVKI